MKQMAQNVTMEGSGALGDSRYLLHDRDTKYTASFLAIIELVHVKTLRLPAPIPNSNEDSERSVRSAKEERLSKLILFGERSLRQAMREYVAHYRVERNHQEKPNVPLFPQVTETRCDSECRGRLRGLLGTSTENPGLSHSHANTRFLSFPKLSTDHSSLTQTLTNLRKSGRPYSLA
jgi:putative transposase